MDPNKLTQKSQAAISEAQNAAVRFGHQQIEVEHLLLALAAQDNGLVPQILSRCEVDPKAFIQALESEIGRQPRVSGPGAQPGQVYVTPRLNSLLVRAEDSARRMQDEFVSVVHLFLAAQDEPTSTGAGRVAASSTFPAQGLGYSPRSAASSG
jgi:ATP-dependent Clp protease ATP-binding subunit ClpB